MRSVIRTPSVKKSVSARTTSRVTRTVKKVTTPAYGKKGVGAIKNPKKSLYNKVYNETSYGVRDIAGSGYSGHSGNNASLNYNELQEPSDVLYITNYNLPNLVQEYPQIIGSIHKQFIKRVVLGILLLIVSIFFIVPAKSKLFFTTGFVLLGVAIYQLYKGNQYRNAYRDASECMRKLHSDETLEYLRKLRS